MSTVLEESDSCICQGDQYLVKNLLKLEVKDGCTADATSAPVGAHRSAMSRHSSPAPAHAFMLRAFMIFVPLESSQREALKKKCACKLPGQCSLAPCSLVHS